MRKLNLGCGGNILAGWENHDADLDITKPLPYKDNSIDFIFIEHCVEHTTTPDAVRFFMEAYRILKPNGVIRIAVPSVVQMMRYIDPQYLDWFGMSGFGQPNKRSAIQSILLNHGHLSAWSHEILESCLYAAGFEYDNIEPELVGESTRQELREIEGHGKVIGKHNNEIETIVMEAVK